MAGRVELPELPIDAWEESKLTLHLFAQIMGKIRMQFMPRKNHWWNITLYTDSTGFTTRPIPLEGGLRTFELRLDVLSDRAEVLTSTGETRHFALGHGLSVAEFYNTLCEALDELGIVVDVVSKPYDLPVEGRFSDLTEQDAWNSEFVRRSWQIMVWVGGVLDEFAGRFYGKTCPVHIYWHHMDLTVTRFHGRRGPALPDEASVGDKDAYSHEVVSAGFWTGDPDVRGAAFYSYTYPSPQGLEHEPLEPSSAQWIEANGSPMALLMYDDLREEADPRAALLGFLESSYRAGAGLAGWDVDDLTVPPLTEL